MKHWVIPPKHSAAFVADMERVLALYAEPYDRLRPVVCFDERPCLLHADVRPPLALRPGRPACQDHEYERRGSCCILMAFDPHRAWRQAWVRPQRRRVEFAAFVRHLVDEVYPDAVKIRLVCDQLNTHAAASFYAAFAPEEARRLAERVEFIYTPVHGSWLNVVEVEFSILVRQCLSRRFGTEAAMAEEVAAWEAYRNAIGGTVEWRMTTADARQKLQRLYPSV